MNNNNYRENFRDAMIGGFTLLIPFVLLSVVDILLLNIPSPGYLQWLYSDRAEILKDILMLIYETVWGNFSFFVVLTVS